MWVREWRRVWVRERRRRSGQVAHQVWGDREQQVCVWNQWIGRVDPQRVEVQQMMMAGHAQEKKEVVWREVKQGG